MTCMLQFMISGLATSGIRKTIAIKSIIFTTLYFLTALKKKSFEIISDYACVFGRIFTKNKITVRIKLGGWGDFKRVKLFKLD